MRAAPPGRRERTCSSLPSHCELALERLGIVAPAGEPLLRYVSWVQVLDTRAQAVDDRPRERRGRELGRQDELVPLVIDGTGKHVEHADAGAQHLGAQR